MMRVVSGTAKGMHLFEVNKETTRPITDRIKTSLFDKIQHFIRDESIVDLYAGTGSMGIEALSRGATFCDFVDRDLDCITIIKKNLDKTKFSEKAKVFSSSVAEYVSRYALKQHYQAILYDPPFPAVREGYDRIANEIISLKPLLKEEGAIIFRHPVRAFEDIEGFEIVSQKEYGSNEITILTPLLG